MRVRWAALPAAAALLIVVLAGTPDGAYAHAGYERSEPAENAVLAESPARVDMYFSQEMSRSEGLPTVTVVNEAGDVIADAPVLDDDDRTHMYVELPPELPPKRYTVIWHSLSDEDGEEAQGAFHFYVGSGPEETEPGASGVPSAAPTATVATNGNENDGDGDGDGAPWWLVAVVGIVGVAAGGGGVLAARARSRD